MSAPEPVWFDEPALTLIAPAAVESEMDEAEPPCTCLRVDVDLYDASYCELCNRNSEYNRRQRALERDAEPITARKPAEWLVVDAGDTCPF